MQLIYTIKQNEFIIRLSKKNIYSYRDDEFTRGTYLIVLSNSNLNTTTLSYFANLKKTQGYDVEVISFREGDDAAIDGAVGSMESQ